MSSSTVAERRGIPWVSILIAGIAAILGSLAANLVVRSIAIRVADIPGGFEPLASPSPILVASIGYGTIAVIAYIITYRLSRNIRRTWPIVGVIGLVVSFLPLLGVASQDGATTAGITTLITMHIVAAIITIPTMLALAGE